MANHKRQVLRIGLNIGMIAFIMFFTLSNTQTLVLSYPEYAVGLYINTVLFHGIVFVAIGINNLCLIPQLLFHRKWFLYFGSLAFLLLTATITSSIYLQHLFKVFPKSELGNFTIFAIDFQIDNHPFIEAYSLTFVHTFLFITGFMLAFIIRHLYVSNKNLQLTKEEQLKAELNLLKAQVNPHFLFNMMNSIYSLSLNKSDDAPATILKLSEILRYNLYETASHFVLLSKELHIMQTYLSLEYIRLDNPEKISFENKVQSSDTLISPMLLLPIVENAFKHGIDSNITQGFINMKAYESSTHFTFECNNNYKKKDRTSESSGLGLVNLRKRLQLIYPGRHTLKINKTENTFEVVLQIKIK